MKKFGAFALGGIIGAAAALLTAPRPGDETRAIVTDWATNTLGNRIELGERVQTRRDQITHDAGIIATQAGIIASDVAQRAKEGAGNIASQVQQQTAQVAQTAGVDSDAELRARIEQARERIAKQVAENAANAREVVGGAIPAVEDAAKDVSERIKNAAHAGAQVAAAPEAEEQAEPEAPAAEEPAAKDE